MIKINVSTIYSIQEPLSANVISLFPQYQIWYTYYVEQMDADGGWMDGWMDGRMDGWMDE